MVAWDVEPAGVQGVLARSEGVAGEFEAQLRGVNRAVSSAAGQSSSPIVAQALQGFAASQQDDVAAMFSRVAAALSGAARATNAYVQGDLEMAANAQQAASSASSPMGSTPGVGG